MKYQEAKPSKDALNYFNAKKLKTSFSYKDIYGEEHRHAFTVAKAMQLDVLADLQNGVQQAIEKGTTFSQFKKELTPLLRQKGWWGTREMIDPLDGKTKTVQLGSPRRLKTIYQTNKATAYAAGKWQRIEATKKTHPYLLYQLGPSENHRLQHLEFNGKLLPADDGFWATHYPPNGWGCKCHVRQVSKTEHARIKNEYSTTSPEIKTRQWVNKRNGVIERVPFGIDPGWDYNPGKDRHLFDKFGHLPDCSSIQLNAFKKGACARKLPNQQTWKTLKLEDVRKIDEHLKLPSPALIGAKNNLSDVLKKSLLGNKANRVIRTPINDVILNERLIDYFINHNDKARIAYANFIVPTLEKPFEVWLPKYSDGSFRPNYIGVFKEKNMLVIVKEAKDGVLVWNAIPVRVRNINNNREGLLLYKK